MKFSALLLFAINLLGAEIPAPINIPSPGPTNDAPYAPQPILQGGVVIPLYPPGSPFLKADRVKEADTHSCLMDNFAKFISYGSLRKVYVKSRK